MEVSYYQLYSQRAKLAKFSISIQVPRCVDVGPDTIDIAWSIEVYTSMLGVYVERSL